ncbi:MAG: InlB B-repeat-containing protein [Lachnospiraceae bacterium]|nr:InlB B-repeat-containing protein [Lachnospiraceae bacterium]
MKKRNKGRIYRAAALALSAIVTAGSIFSCIPAPAAYAAISSESVRDGVGEISITASAGYEEGAYIEWSLLDGADGYEVAVSKDKSTWTVIDDELVRKYKSGTTEYMRADALGLTAGTWYFKIVAGKYDSSGVKKSDVTEKISDSVTVRAHDRSGFAWVNKTSGYYTVSDNDYSGTDANGAYNADGSIKENADIIYVTEDNKNTVTLTIKDKNNKDAKLTGIQNIIAGYKNNSHAAPLDVRFIGRITDPAVLTDGDLYMDEVTAGLTLEGVGKDAAIAGFGLVIKKSSNVEVRNLGFLLCDSKEGDSVSLPSGDDHIWVHHCDFFYGEEPATDDGDNDHAKGDGALDCKESDYITFSYNHFWDCGKCCLLGNSMQALDEFNITYHHNWFDHSDSRHPRARYYNAHVYNNYFDGISKYGMGSVEGASIFSESNYFRNVQKPMLISMQGNDSGTFSKEDGGMIKAYGNSINGSSIKYTPYSETNNVEFDAYEVTAKTETIPDTVKTKQGDNVYDNFDTRAGFYAYTADAAADVPTKVKASAGRVQGGDISYEFADSEDSNYAVISALKTQLTEYMENGGDLESVGGVTGSSEDVYYTLKFKDGSTVTTIDAQQVIGTPVSKTLAPDMSGKTVPEGKYCFGYWTAVDPSGTEECAEWDFSKNVTTDVTEGNKTDGYTFTLYAYWYTEAEYESTLRGGTPIGNDVVTHNFVTDGFGSRYFEITGNTKTENGTSGTYEGYTWPDGKQYIYGRNRLIMDAEASVKFTTTADESLLVLLLDKAKTGNVNIDGTAAAPADGVILKALSAGEHTITYAKDNYLYGIIVKPGEGVPGKASAANTLNVGEDMTAGEYTSDQTVKIFTIHASATDGKVTVDANSKTIGGTAYTQRLKLGGAGDANKRSISFKAIKAATLRLMMVSSSGSDARKLNVAEMKNGALSVIKGSVNIAGTATECADGNIPVGTTAAVYELSLPEAGEYYIYATDGGVNFYAVEVVYSGGESDPGNDPKDPENPEDPENPSDPEDGEAQTVYYTVSFNSLGAVVSSNKVVSGNTVSAPSAPAREGYEFEGWYTSQAAADALNESAKYDFASKVEADLTLYAGWKSVSEDDGKNEEESTEDSYDHSGDKEIADASGNAVTYELEDTVFYYTGTAVKPAVKLYGNGRLLSEGVDYTLKYSNNKLASADADGKALAGVLKAPSITVSGKGNYRGKFVIAFNIRQRSLSDSEVAYSDAVVADVTKAVPKMSCHGVNLKNNKDFTYALKGSVLEVKGQGNYCGTLNIPVNVKSDSKAVGKISISVEKKTYAYDGKAHDASADKIVTVKDASGNILKAGSDYVIVLTDNINAGTMKITVCGRGDYVGLLTKKLKITPAQITPAVSGIAASYTYAYGGVYPEPVVKSGSTVLTKGVDYKLSYSKNKAAGTAAVKVTLTGNYKGTVTKNFEIKPASLSGDTFRALAPDQVSNGNTGTYYSKPYVELDHVLIKASEYSCSYYTDAACKKEITKQSPLTVASSPVTVYVKITGKGKNYTGTAPVISYKVYPAGKASLAKAAVTLKDSTGNKLKTMSFTGKLLKPAKAEVTLSGSPVSSGYTVSCFGNVYKGMAVAVVSGDGKTYAGSKAAKYSVKAGDIETLTKSE